MHTVCVSSESERCIMICICTCFRMASEVSIHIVLTLFVCAGIPYTADSHAYLRLLTECPECCFFSV